MSAAEASHPNLRAARAVSAARRKRADADRRLAEARLAVTAAAAPRRGHATDPHAATCTVGLIAASLAFGAAGDARGPAPLLREARERSQAATAALDLGADPERRDGSGATALALAVRRGYVSFALELVKRGARPDGGDGSALEAAARLAAAGARRGRARGGAAAGRRVGAHAGRRFGLASRRGARRAGKRRPRITLAGRRVSSDRNKETAAVRCRGLARRLRRRRRDAALDPGRGLRRGRRGARGRRRRGRRRARARRRAGDDLRAEAREAKVLDATHEHVGLVLVDDDDGAAGDAELEDGTAVKLAQLAADCRLFWRLRRAPRPRVATSLHAACAAGASSKALDLILKGREDALTARDADGRTPLGVALAAGQKSAAAWCLKAHEHFSTEQAALADTSTAWPEPQFDAVCLRAASRRAHGADAELRRWRRQSVLVDADLEAEHAAVDRGGAAPRLASVCRRRAPWRRNSPGAASRRSGARRRPCSARIGPRRRLGSLASRRRHWKR